MDATKDIDIQQQIMRAIVAKVLEGYTTKRRNYAKREKDFWRKFGLS
jgi:hypothetical protein